MDVSPSGPSLRWTNFEDTLRRRREEVLQSSIDNAKLADSKLADSKIDDAKRPSVETGSEFDAQQRRKAS